MSLHLGLVLPNYGPALDPEALARAANAAEAAGFDSGWVTDHLLVPAEHAPTYGTIAEALVSLGYLAGRTTTLQLGVSALIVPQRNPLVVLKQLASLDLLSDGRLVMAVAAGWMEGEFRTLGADFEHRGRALNDWLELASSVYAQPPGPVLNDAWMAPALVRRGGLELWVAGVSRATLRRAARTGVWHPVGLRPDEVRAMAQEFRALRADGRVVLRINAYFAKEPDREGADERGRYAIAGPPEWIAERLAELVEAGCDGFVLNLDQERPALEERVARFGAEVRPLLDGP